MIDCGTKTTSSGSSKFVFKCTTTTNNSQYSSFTIKVFKINYLGYNPYMGSDVISCSIPKGKSSVTDTATIKGLTPNTKYNVQFWKGNDSKYIIGSGTLTY